MHRSPPNPQRVDPAFSGPAIGGLALLVVALALAACVSEGHPDAGPVAEASDDAIAPEWCDNLPRAQYSGLPRGEVSSDWFEVYAVGEGVFAIYEPRQWQEVISYLVLGSERGLLLDTGMGIAPISEVVAELTALPVTVLNSHSHFDHVGGNAEFDQVIGMDTDFTRSRAGGLPNERVRSEVGPDAVCGSLPDGFTPDGYLSRPWHVTETARDGYRIELGGRTLEVLHVPGHTPDALALLDREAGYLWTGDSFYEGPIWLFAPETDLDQYRSSIERLAALAPELERVFPAHNTPIADPTLLVEARDAFEAIRSGSLAPASADETSLRYDVGRSFSFLLRREPES